MKSVKATARLAGVLYLVMGLMGWFSIMYVPGALIVRGDAAATASNIMDAELLFRFGVLSQFLSQSIILPTQMPVVSLVTLSLAGIGETATILWLLIKGAKEPPAEDRVIA